jgi:membrane protease YdiL (CAAX protease family)
VNRVLAFLRSVLPEDPTQLVFLLGIVCLLIAPNLRWNLGVVIQASARSVPNLRVFVGLALAAIYLAASAGYFFCFRPSGQPASWLLGLVCLPALAGILIFCGYSIIFSSLSALPNLGPGFHYALIGFVLVAAFTCCLALGLASLPLALPESSVCDSDNSSSWNGVLTFLWVFLGLLPFISWIFPVWNMIYYFVRSHFPAFGDTIAVSAELFVADAVIILIAVWIIGEEARDALRSSLRWPSAEGLLLAVVFPVGVSALISLGQFLLDRLRSAVHQPEMLSFPHIGSYFTIPSIGLLSLLFVAFSDEVIFRGLLQPLFIQRYDIPRGIFLVGVAYAAWHFSSDFSAGFTDGSVIVRLCFRLIGSLALSFVAGWLTFKRDLCFRPPLPTACSIFWAPHPSGPDSRASVR